MLFAPHLVNFPGSRDRSPQVDLQHRHHARTARARPCVANDPRIPDEVSYKAGYVNPVARPGQFHFSPALGHRDCRHASAGPRIGPGRSRLDQPDLPDRRPGGCPQRRRRPGARRPLPAPALVCHRRARSHSAGLRSARITAVVLARGTAQRSGLALLEPVAARRTAGRQARRLHRPGPGHDFSRGLAADGHGLLAFSDHPVRLRRKQSRSRRQRLVFSLSRSGRKPRSPILAARNSS